MSEVPTPIVLCCLLWAAPDEAAGLTAYEDRVLPWIPEHGGAIRQRVIGDGRDDRPHEVQILSFPDQAALDAYLTDPRRLALSGERDRVIARTELFPVRLQ